VAVQYLLLFTSIGYSRRRGGVLMDDDCCDGCGKSWQLGWPAYETDHIIPYWFSKDLSETNTHALCRDCHRAKSKEEESIRIAYRRRLITEEETANQLKRISNRYKWVI
jgi:5-methylcytosine-specific restriction endonuclease McrA